MERFQSGLFRKIVFVHMTQALVFAAAEDVGYSHVFDMNNVCIRVLKQNSNRRLTD